MTVGGEPKTLDVKLRVGQVGESWGNLLLPEGEMERDQEIVFDGEDPAKRYWITRVLTYPLDTSKRLYYYERVPRWRHPPPDAPSPKS